MKIEVKSAAATLGKFMVEFNSVYPTIFLRFYKSDDFSLDNRLPHNTKVKDFVPLPVIIEAGENITLLEMDNLLTKKLGVKYIEIVYYPKTGAGALRFVGSELQMSIKQIMEKGIREEWLTEKQKGKLKLS
jgi:hypothetical protein